METLPKFKSHVLPEYVLLFIEDTESRWQFASGYNADRRLRRDTISRFCEIMQKYVPINNSASVHENLKDLFSKGIHRFSAQVVICYFNANKTLTPLVHLKNKQEINEYYQSLHKS